MKQFFFLSAFCLFVLAAAPARAQACTDNADCSPETCIALVCVPLSSIGGPCDSGDGGDCQSGNCDATTCIASSSGSGSSSGSSGSSGGSSGSGSSGAGGPPCTDPNFELPSGYPQAVESRFNLGAAATNVPDYIVDIGRYVNEGGEHKYAVRKITGNALPTINAVDYKSIAQINALGQDKLFFIATLPPAGPLSTAGNTVAAIRASAAFYFPGLLNICPVLGSGISE